MLLFLLLFGNDCGPYAQVHKRQSQRGHRLLTIRKNSYKAQRQANPCANQAEDPQSILFHVHFPLLKQLGVLFQLLFLFVQQFPALSQQHRHSEGKKAAQYIDRGIQPDADAHIV